MTKFTTVTKALVGAALLVAVTSCSSPVVHGGATNNAALPSVPAGSTMEKWQQEGKIVVGSKFSAPLFGEKSPISGEVEGFDAEIARELGRRVFGEDGHVEFVEAPTPSREAMIEQGKVDFVIATYTITPERNQLVNFAGPYFYAELDLVVKADNKTFGDSIQGYEALAGHSVCATLNGTQYNLIQQVAPTAELIGFDDPAKCLTAVDQGRVEAHATDTGTAIGMLSSNPGTYREVSNPRSDSQPYGIGVPKQDTELCEWINTELDEIIAEGHWEKAFSATIGQVVEAVPASPKAAEFSYCS
jgi:glutamate transport system substrate-binding protein